MKIHIADDSYLTGKGMIALLIFSICLGWLYEVNLNRLIAKIGGSDCMEWALGTKENIPRRRVENLWNDKHYKTRRTFSSGDGIDEVLSGIIKECRKEGIRLNE